MSTVTKDQVIEWLSGQSVIELAALVKDLEGKWGVSAAAAVAATPAAGAAAAPAAEAQTEFTVVPGEARTRSASSRKSALSPASASREAKDLVEPPRSRSRRTPQGRSRGNQKKLGPPEPRSSSQPAAWRFLAQLPIPSGSGRGARLALLLPPPFVPAAPPGAP